MVTLALMDQATRWWDERSLAEQVFYGIGLAAGLVAIILMVLAIFGMEHDDAVDAIAAGDVDHDGGGGIFSIKPLTGFFLGFGWIGGMALNHGSTLLVATVLAFLAGSGMMSMIVFMFRAILNLKSDGTARIDDTVGAVGTVYITLPPSKASGGQVVVTFRGRQETYSALNNGESVIPSGDKVKVLSVVDGRTLLVERHS
jgi:hypothetical protein